MPNIGCFNLLGAIWLAGALMAIYDASCSNIYHFRPTENEQCLGLVRVDRLIERFLVLVEVSANQLA